MAGTQIQFRRGTTAQHATFTGAAGEITVDTDKNVPVVHNGSTPGGFPVAKAGALASSGISGAAAIGANNDITSLLALLSINGGQVGGLRNLLTNAGFKVDQRNLGSAQTFTAGAALAYCVDRWYGYCTGANVNGQQVANAADQFVYRFTGAASVTGIGFGHRMEFKDTAHLAGKTATLAVDTANTLLTSVTWTAYYANTADTFGTLASPTRTQIATGSFTVNSTLTRYNAQIAIPAAATTGIEVVLSVGAQTSGTWLIGKPQLELGSVATVFEERNFGDELRRCQRYLPAWNLGNGQAIVAGYAYGTVSAEFALPYPVQPRVIPTGIIASTNRFACTTSAGALSTTSTVTLNGAASSLYSLSLLLNGTGGLAAGNGTILYATGGTANIFATGCEL